ncbi:MAG: PilX N-terminal domain-containing pilus assembly protein [Gammaproteobacteria bacterium]
MLHKPCSIHSKTQQQNGFVLIVALLLLLVLTILGLAAAQSTSVQERMAGNARNHDLAFQSAEAGLNAAYSGVLQNLWSNADFAGNANGLYLLSSCCAPATAWTSAWTVPGAWTTALPISNPVPGLTIPGQLAQQPVFIIEELPPVAPPGSNLAQQQNGSGSPPVQPYRITVYATGGDQTTSVVLQTVVTQ